MNHMALFHRKGMSLSHFAVLGSMRRRILFRDSPASPLAQRGQPARASGTPDPGRNLSTCGQKSRLDNLHLHVKDHIQTAHIRHPCVRRQETSRDTYQTVFFSRWLARPTTYVVLFVGCSVGCLLDCLVARALLGWFCVGRLVGWCGCWFRYGWQWWVLMDSGGLRWLKRWVLVDSVGSLAFSAIPPWGSSFPCGQKQMVSPKSMLIVLPWNPRFWEGSLLSLLEIQAH